MSWYSPFWSRRFTVTFDHTKIAVDGYIDLLITEANVPSGFWSVVKSDGGDIVVTAADGTTKLSRDLLAIDTTNSKMQLRIRAQASSSTDAVVYVYAGNPAGSETNDTATYDANLLAYWSLNESPGGAGSMIDRTGNYNGTPNSLSQATGKLGNCLEWANELADYADGGAVGPTSGITVMGWFYLDTRGGTAAKKMVTRRTNGGTNPWVEYSLELADSGNDDVSFNLSKGTTGTLVICNSGSNTLPLTTWKLVTGTWPISGAIKLYFDTTQVGSQTGFTGPIAGTSSNNVYLGNWAAPTGQPWDGKIDEVRIWSRAMQTTELTTRYNNESNPGSFYACGTLETGGYVDLAGAVAAQSSFVGEIEVTTTAAYVDLAGSIAAQSALSGDLWVGVVRPAWAILTSPGARCEVRRVPLDWIRRDPVSYVVDLELVGIRGGSETPIWAAEPWLELSTDDGSTWSSVGTTRATAADAGELAAGERKPVKLRLTVPAAAALRSRSVGIYLGRGVDA